MVLTYDIYIRLQKALSEHALAKGYKSYAYPCVAQNRIYEHYMNFYGSLVAVNSHGTKKLFINKKENRKSARKAFRDFMDKDKYEEDTYHYHYVNLSSKHSKSNFGASGERTEETESTSSQDSLGSSQTGDREL